MVLKSHFRNGSTASSSVGNQTSTLHSPCTSMGRELCLLGCAGFCAGFFGALHPAGPQLHPVVPVWFQPLCTSGS